MTFREIIAEILITTKPLRRKTTQTRYDWYFSVIEDHLGEQEIEDFNRLKYMAFISLLRNICPDRTTFNDYTKYFNILFKYAFDNQKIDLRKSFPKVDVAFPREGRVYTHAELASIWNEIPSESDMELQFVLSFECYMRKREMLKLKKSNLDLKNKIITLHADDVKTGSRTGKGRTFAMSANAYTLIVKQLYRLSKHEYYKHSIYLFPSPLLIPSKDGNRNAVDKPCDDNKTAWKKIKHDAKIFGKGTWHDIRHTSLSMAIFEGNIPLSKLSKVCGTSEKTLEKIYLHAKIEHLREVSAALDINKIRA